MRFLIRHVLQYHYDRPVFLEPLTVRLRPRTDHAQRLARFTLHIKPEPTDRTDVLDAAGNVVRTGSFSGVHETLTIRSRAVVFTHLENPFAYLVTDPQALRLPVTYTEPERTVLQPYLAPTDPSVEVGHLSGELLRESGADTTEYLRLAVMRVSQRCRQIARAEGDPWSPEMTLRQGEGACRDVAILFIALCRAVGLAARFVSGYQVVAEGSAQPEMHAWTEVYLPGGGWRGYDPSAGLATADRHVPVASAPGFEGAEPTRGTYRGTGVRSEFGFRLRVEERERRRERRG